MKKKIGELIITDTNTQSEERSIIWGTIYKTNDGKLFGGIYISIKPEMLEISLPIIKSLMSRCSFFKLSYVSKFYGEYYSLGAYGLLDRFNYDLIIGRLGYTQPIHDGSRCMDYEIKMYHDFQYVVDANVVDKI